ncbi:CRISPR-associated helicase Cas3' [Streptomyces sp. NBC_00133]|uniref:CRISPR-associated helicase Cas3' n=1 Tax=Streptomyces sp. NBC_00133 TaxID=2903624 RepID=UPI003254B0A1
MDDGDVPDIREVSDADPMIAALWGKSKEKAGGRKNLLLSHLLDTAAVAERMWDGVLAPSTRRLIDEVAGGPGAGRRFFAWLCGVHDCGKATPAFQRLWPEGGDAVRAAGLMWHEPIASKFRWRHDKAGGNVVRAVLGEAGWLPEHVAWVWPIVAGHHGAFPSQGQLQPPRMAKGQLQGTGLWADVQRALVEQFTYELGYGGVGGVAPVQIPARAVQLHLSGLVVMADWIASDEEHFPGIDDIGLVSIAGARERAAKAWERLGLRGGWGQLREPGPEAFADRFGHGARSSQRMVLEAARRMTAPGLLVVEAPMGEGKTKTALLAAEVLAARFGADGVFVGMPTQATSDPMFSQVRAWLDRVEDGLASQVALLHGKSRFNKEWKKLLDGAEVDAEHRFGGVDEYGECCDDDLYGPDAAAFGGEPAGRGQRGPAEWFLGPKRGLLCPFVVGTIDQLLFAATRTRHVMLRMAGLAGKVVVLDEVHAADVYMSQFLMEGLRWLGQAGVPVVLLSATLPPGQRRDLVGAYLAGAASREESVTQDLPEPQGYPNVTAAWLPPGQTQPELFLDHCDSWRDDLPVRVERLSEVIPGRHRPRDEHRAAQEAADRSVADVLERDVGEAGCALVIRNTVDRAQSLYRELRARFGADVRLLHGRLTVAERADRTVDCLDLLGPPPKPGEVRRRKRPGRLILVATQLAEQSFDVDADLLVTDLAPIDLLLQRIGRLHRHEGVSRPQALSVPRVVVTGCAAGEDGAPPHFLGASEAIYGRFLLLRSMACIDEAVGDAGGWQIPRQVPELVRRVYESSIDAVPDGWTEAEEEARAQWAREQRERVDSATPHLLTRLGEHEQETLAGLHFTGASIEGGEQLLEAVVRDGERSAEVILVVNDGGMYRTLSGRPLTAGGDVADELLDEVLGSTVRLPTRYSKAAEEELRPLPGWYGHPWLGRSRALVLDNDRRASLGGRLLCYDDELGLAER